MTLLVTPDATAEARRALGERPALIVSQWAVVDSDAARARDAARPSLRFLSGVRGYPASFARMGFSPEEVSGLGDRLVDALVARGSAGEIAARVSEHLEAGADHVALTVLGREGRPAGLAAARELADALPC
jgi:probable F420-dependent oxidoreductase